MSNLASQDQRLITFARATLSILERGNWGAEELMDIAEAAKSRDLAESDEDGMFQSTLESVSNPALPPG